MNERIALIRKDSHLSQDAFGKRLGVTGASISRLEKGERNVTDQMILAMCREFNVSEEWLRTGNGSMYMEMSRAELAAKIVGNALATDDEFILNTFIALGQLSPSDWEVIKRFIDKIKG